MVLGMPVFKSSLSFWLQLPARVFPGEAEDGSGGWVPNTIMEWDAC